MTDKQLIVDLQPYSTNPQVAKIIANARAKLYHDFASCAVTPKMLLIEHLRGVDSAELKQAMTVIHKKVLAGDYDEDF